jgi:hypothetical protein
MLEKEGLGPVVEGPSRFARMGLVALVMSLAASQG